MPLSIKDYLEYYKHIAIFKTLNQESINVFLAGHNNLVSRAFLKNFIKFLQINKVEFKLSPEELISLSEIEFPKLNKRSKNRDLKYLNYYEIKQLNSSIPNKKYKLMFAINFFGALRLEELINIKYSDFDWDGWNREGQETPIELKILGKGGKFRIVFIPTGVAKALDRYFQIDGKKVKKVRDEVTNKEKLIEIPVFQVKRNTYQSAIADYSKKFIQKQIFPHVLRHSFASYLMKQGWDLNKIKEYLGHADISTTQVYLHVNIADLKRDFEGLNFG